MKGIEKRDFIVFGEDFNRHPHALEHLMRRFLPHNRILWVETLGLRSPKFSLYDLKRAMGIMKKWLGKNEETPGRPLPENLTVVSPVMIPYHHMPIIRKFNQWMVIRSVRKALGQLDMKRPIFITSVPQACDFVHKFHEGISVYYCVDEFSLWPGINANLARALEEDLLTKVDLVFATSRELVRTKSKKGKEAALLTHGVDLDHFLVKGKTPKGPIKNICYYGLIDERCDQELLLKISREFPQLTLNILGNVIIPISSELRNRHNVFFKGFVDYKNLPEAISREDAFILPYHMNELTKNINPLKLKEYLSTGKPVVVTPLPEAIHLKDYLYVAYGHSQFLETLKNLISGQWVHRGDLVVDYLAKHETWAGKADLLAETLIKREHLCQN